jgi:hypothetical protein
VPALVLDSIREFEIVRICLNTYVLSGCSPMLEVQADFKIPLPLLEIQKQIVEELDKEMEV